VSALAIPKIPNLLHRLPGSRAVAPPQARDHVLLTGRVSDLPLHKGLLWKFHSKPLCNGILHSLHLWGGRGVKWFQYYIGPINLLMSTHPL
jgi:hypothetical protein